MAILDRCRNVEWPECQSCHTASRNHVSHMF